MCWCSGRRSAGLPCRCGLSSTARTSCCASSRCSRTWRRGGSGFMSPSRRSSISCVIFPGPIMTMGRMRSKCFGVWHPPDSSAWATPTSGCRWKGSGAMTGRMEDGEGGGAPSEEGFPSQTCWRGSRPPLPSKPFGWWGGGPVGVPLDGDGARCGRFFTVKKAVP